MQRLEHTSVAFMRSKAPGTTKAMHRRRPYITLSFNVGRGDAKKYSSTERWTEPE